MTWPIGDPPSGSTAAPSVGTSPFASVKPTSAVSGGSSASRSSAHLPMKSWSLSSFTIHGIAAPNGVDSESVSWPDEDVHLLEAQQPLRLEPERAQRRARAPASSSASQRCSPCAAGKWIS